MNDDATAAAYLELRFLPPFLTDISKAWPAEMRSLMERQIPMGGWAYRAS